MKRRIITRTTGITHVVQQEGEEGSVEMVEEGVVVAGLGVQPIMTTTMKKMIMTTHIMMMPVQKKEESEEDL